MSMIDNLEAMLAKGQDNAMLRLSLGNAYLKADNPGRAVEHLRAALGHDPQYSAAWKALGQALVDSGDKAAAIEVYGEGIDVAEGRGDKQAAKEMQAFKRRLEKQRAS